MTESDLVVRHAHRQRYESEKKKTEGSNYEILTSAVKANDPVFFGLTSGPSLLAGPASPGVNMVSGALYGPPAGQIAKNIRSEYLEKIGVFEPKSGITDYVNDSASGAAGTFGLLPGMAIGTTIQYSSDRTRRFNEKRK